MNATRVALMLLAGLVVAAAGSTSGGGRVEVETAVAPTAVAVPVPLPPSPSRYWITVAILELKTIFSIVPFAYVVAPILYAVLFQTDGVRYVNLTTQVTRVQRTLTAWDSAASMRNFAYGAGSSRNGHAQAVRNASLIASYIKVYSFYSDTIPTWDESIRLLEANGRVTLGAPRDRDLTDGDVHSLWRAVPHLH